MKHDEEEMPTADLIGVLAVGVAMLIGSGAILAWLFGFTVAQVLELTKVVSLAVLGLALGLAGIFFIYAALSDLYNKRRIPRGFTVEPKED